MNFENENASGKDAPKKNRRYANELQTLSMRTWLQWRLLLP